MVSAAQLAAAGFSYVARQPILTVDEKVYGYELLFRDGVENHFAKPILIQLRAAPWTLRC